MEKGERELTNKTSGGGFVSCPNHTSGVNSLMTASSSRSSVTDPLFTRVVSESPQKVPQRPSQPEPGILYLSSKLDDEKRAW